MKTKKEIEEMLAIVQDIINDPDNSPYQKAYAEGQLNALNWVLDEKKVRGK